MTFSTPREVAVVPIIVKSRKTKRKQKKKKKKLQESNNRGKSSSESGAHQSSSSSISSSNTSESIIGTSIGTNRNCCKMDSNGEEATSSTRSDVLNQQNMGLLTQQSSSLSLPLMQNFDTLTCSDSCSDNNSRGLLTQQRSSPSLASIQNCDSDIYIDNISNSNSRSSVDIDATGNENVEHSTSTNNVGDEIEIDQTTSVGGGVEGVEAETDIMTRVANNKRRNEQRLIDLGLQQRQEVHGDLKHQHKQKQQQMNNEKTQKKKSNKHAIVEKDSESPQGGMIFSTKYNQYQNHKYQCQERHENISLDTIYPYREKEIRLLRCCFHTTIRQAQNHLQQQAFHSKNAIYIPPPIFVTGTGGTGKTSIVRDVLHQVQYEQYSHNRRSDLSSDIGSNMNINGGTTSATKAGVAYINCSTIGANANCINTILQDIYRQLVYDFEVRSFDREILKGEVSWEHQHIETSNIGNNKDSKNSRKEGKVSHKVSGGNDSIENNYEKEDEETTMKTRTTIISDTTDKQNYMRRIIENEYNLENFLHNDYHDEKDDDYDYSDQNHSQYYDEEDWIEMKKRHHLKNFKKRKSDLGELNNNVSKSKKQKSLAKEAHDDSPRRSGRLQLLNQTPSSNISNQSRAISPSVVQLSNDTITATKMKKNEINKNVVKLLTPIAFGRAITKYCGTTKYGPLYHHCGFLVLDHAEKLLSIDGGSGNKKNSNLLSQLLLLPKVMNLNLTVVIITDKMLLEHTRINNIHAQHHKMFGSITEAISPIHCHFNTYKGKEIFKDILMTPRLQKLIIGENEEGGENFMLVQLYKSSVEILVQSVESTTRDVREMLRLLGIIWPFYLKPLLNDEKSNNGELLEQCFPGDTDKFVLSGQVSEILGKKVRPYVKRMLNECLLQPGQTLHENEQMIEHGHEDKGYHRTPTFAQGLPYNSKFLLLAAYLCQSNTSDYDRKLYTNKASGKRKRNRKNQHNGSSVENITHASSTRAQSLRSERIPSFPLERMLSIFSSIYNKYAQAPPGTEINVDDLGSISLFANIAELRQLGFLSCMNTCHDGQRSHYSKTLFTKYTCNISREEATLLSSEVSFPLKDYLAENF